MSKAAEIVTCNETADAFQKLYYEKLDKQVCDVFFNCYTIILLIVRLNILFYQLWIQLLVN